MHDIKDTCDLKLTWYDSTQIIYVFSDNQTTLIWRLATLHSRTGTSKLKVFHLIWNCRQYNHFGTIIKILNFPKAEVCFLHYLYLWQSCLNREIILFLLSWVVRNFIVFSMYCLDDNWICRNTITNKVGVILRVY